MLIEKRTSYMKRKIYYLAISVATGITFAFTPNASANEVSGGVSAGAASARGSDQPAQLFGDGGIFAQITNIMLFVIGAISVIMIIIGGLRYILSGGDSANVSAAKNTILYAIVGVIVALLAFAAVRFITGAFTEGGSFTGGSGGGGATNF
ncbi:MAG: hypothetical protein UY35_C0009G0018 [Candidatus Saccharibacteria bacterium GW2011_GWC2_48_9]|nr:MAG: hypothetical protein UY35_C0009G0018 [Candidatus Saccharibacteria bacterium GW2011_GWC2_48_9]